MKNLIIAIVMALSAYAVAILLNGQIESLSIAPVSVSLFAGIGAYGAMLISHGMHR